MNSELAAMIALAERMSAADVHGTLATLFAARGSTYRPLGSMMVSVPGQQAGSVSGGCLDEYVAREGVLATQGRSAAVLSFSTAHEPPDGAPVLGCGGAIEILVERLTPAHVAWLKEWADAAAGDAASVLHCLVDGSNGGVEVRRRWLHVSGRSGTLPRDLAVMTRTVLRDGRTCHVPLGDDSGALFQYVPPQRRLVIVGAGDDAGPVCDLGKLLGWHVTVADRRARLATNSRFPRADVVIAGEWPEIVGRVPITAHTAIVLMTHRLEDDACVLAQLDGRAPAYIGALGPAPRGERLLEKVAANGARLPASLDAQMCGPIGLDLGDRSPAGIAVAVVAEILARMNDRDASPLSRKCALTGGGARSVCHA